jgi:hypothetical protein
MRIYKEMNLENFEPWSGAVETFDRIYNEGKINELENLLDEMYIDGIEEVQLNDLLWFESEWLFEVLGIEEEEE